MFIEEGMKYFVELVNSASFNASVIIFTTVISKFAENIGQFTDDNT
jgi:hypothetical protein